MTDSRLMPGIAFLIWVFLVSGSLPAVAGPDGPILAVMPVEPVGLQMSDEMVERLTTLLTGIMGASGEYQVVPREQAREGLVELKVESHKPCYSNSCHIQLGHALAADKAMQTQIIKAGSYCTVSINLLDLKTEASEKGTIVDGGCSEDVIMRSLKVAASAFDVTIHNQSGSSGAGGADPAPPEVGSTVPRVKSSAVTRAYGDLTIQAKTAAGVAVRLTVTDPSGKVIVTGSPYKVPEAAIGSWKVVAEATGHMTDKQSVFVQPDDASLLKMVLEPFGSIKVSGVPSGAAIKVSGPDGFNERGGIPWEAEGLHSGDYTIEVSRSGYHSTTRKVSLRPGQEFKVSIDLEKVLPPAPAAPSPPRQSAPAPSRPSVDSARPAPPAPVDNSISALSSRCRQGDDGACRTAGDKLSGLDKAASSRPAPVADDVRQAVELYDIACNRNNYVACNQLGVLYTDGLGVRQDDRKAFDYFSKSCELGSLLGCYHYGLHLKNGWGCSRDWGKASGPLDRACNEGNIGKACFSAGQIWAQGRGVKRDLMKAALLYRKGCDAGENACCSALRSL